VRSRQYLEHGSFHAIDLSEVTGCECRARAQRQGAPQSGRAEFKSVFSRALFDWIPDQIAIR
jgi:hypothetical protein